ncbi:MAG: hypothetical protein KDD34_00795, partial [Bdellovibrionales bacterium]|nr:hypothetical protein [Bdellovibrionales bacterium]
MKLRLTAPSKTFLVGEYAILHGGHALLANTEPRFEVIISTPGEGRCENIHPNSPAGQWARTHREAFEKIDFQFIDPHQGRGGFGASSAQFLLAWAWSLLDQVPFSRLTEGLDLSQILKDYHSLFEEKSTRPSGGDVVAQSIGGICQVATAPLTMTEKSWPFKDLDFLIIPTGKKINTHKHLEGLSDAGIEELKDVS